MLIDNFSSIVDGFDKVVDSAADAPAMLSLRNTISFREISRLADDVASGLLQKGVAKGDRIAVHMMNRFELVAVYYACFKIGAIVIPLSSRASSIEIESLILHSTPHYYIGDMESFALCEEVFYKNDIALPGWVVGLNKSCAEMVSFGDLTGGEQRSFDGQRTVRSDDVAVIFYTSGTTGEPKGIVFSHETLAEAIKLTGLTFNSERDKKSKIRKDAVHSLVGISSAWGMLSTLAALSHGRPVAIIDRNYETPAVLQLLRTHNIGWLAGAPSNFVSLLNEYRRQIKADSSASINLNNTVCIAGGDSCPAGLASELLQALGATLGTTYGQTETCAPVFQHPDLNMMEVPAIGWSLPGVEIKIKKIHGETRALQGELMLRSPAKPLGFWSGGKMKSFDRESWLPTGDIVQQREDGCLLFIGRKDDQFMVEGYPVSPLEVEKTLQEYEGVSAAIVFAVPDSQKGSKGIAIVETSGCNRLTAEDLHRHLLTKIAVYKQPKEFYLVKSLADFLVNGKISRKQLALRYRNKHEPFLVQ